MNYSTYSNDELNVAVATKKGWKQREPLRFNAWVDANGYSALLSKWSTSMDACMELIEEMRKEANLTIRFLVGDVSIKHHTEMLFDDTNGFIYEKTLPRAVVIAYLTWLDEKDK